MSEDTWEKKWKRMKGTLREHWDRLTDADVEGVEGSRERLLQKIQQRYDESKEWAEKKLKEYERRF